jgi:hypothetical protein
VARKFALIQIAALVVLGIGLVSCGYPTAPECGQPNAAHTAPISADQHFIITPKDHCRIDDYVVYDYNSVQTTALNWQCTSFAQLPDWGLVLTGCSPPVSCYSALNAPVIDPPAVPPSLPPSATPTPVPSFIATPAPAGSPVVNGQPHC